MLLLLDSDDESEERTPAGASLWQFNVISPLTAIMTYLVKTFSSPSSSQDGSFDWEAGFGPGTNSHSWGTDTAPSSPTAIGTDVEIFGDDDGDLKLAGEDMEGLDDEIKSVNDVKMGGDGDGGSESGDSNIEFVDEEGEKELCYVPADTVWLKDDNV